MNLTYKDLCRKLKRTDEITVLELLDISSEDLVDRFSDVIEDNFDKLESYFEDDDEDEEEELY